MENPSFLKLLKLLYNGHILTWNNTRVCMDEDNRICVIGTNLKDHSDVLLPMYFDEWFINCLQTMANDIGDFELSTRLALNSMEKK